MRYLFLSLGLMLLVSGCNEPIANKPADRDNTAVNERDADGDNATPFDQSNDQADIDLVAKIRANVLEIDDLSTNGRNVKIITNDGNVVLRGPVATAAERTAIEQVAKDAAGADKVTSQLEVEAE
ncbi:BON domain-containing protein [Lignipirellula cremea]|uniref:BON domain protein n=1 Tax=Lignipirellula cremea TaxID=2528010 RepID=A0A518E270_9BACT|nr:BON domain-containing protein [Lignipirellula cremea]QDU98163.1 BON domain protein [Lignipirellula cremea]